MKDGKKNIDLAIKYINLAIKDYNKFLIEINKLSQNDKSKVLKWLRNALKYVDKETKK